MTNGTHNVYVVELAKDVLAKKKVLDLNPGYDTAKPPLYVGMSGLSAEERFKKHKLGLKANVWVNKHGLKLRPELYKGLSNLKFHEAERSEEELANKLRREGYPILGGNPQLAGRKIKTADDQNPGAPGYASMINPEAVTDTFLRRPVGRDVPIGGGYSATPSTPVKPYVEEGYARWVGPRSLSNKVKGLGSFIMHPKTLQNYGVSKPWSWAPLSTMTSWAAISAKMEYDKIRDFIASHLHKQGDWTDYDKKRNAEVLPTQQERIVKKIKDPKTPGLVLFHGMGSGKGLVVGTNILTPTGWRAIETLRPGDLVFSGLGTPTKVLGVYPQGFKDTYKVTFRDGVAVECDDTHLWFTTTYTERKNHSRSKDQDKYKWIGKVRSTLELKESVLHKGALNHVIPTVSPIQFGLSNLPVDPYFMGLMLGDGDISAGCAISTADEEILVSIRNLFPTFTLNKYSKYVYGLAKPAGKHKNSVIQEFKKLNLLGTDCFTKFIPDCYLFSDIKSRIALLQGLMDTDGTVSKNGMTCTFESVSKQLAKGAQFIVESLGGTAKITTRIPTYTYKGEKKKGALCYRVWLSLPPDVIPFRLARKVARFVPKTKYLPTRYIQSIESVGKKETVCIAVDHPSHLYVTEHCVVTHNTRASIEAYKALGMPADVIVPAALKENYRKELKKWIGKVPSDVNIVSQQRFANPNLKTPLYDKGLQVVDEAQKARNPANELYQRLAATHPKKRLLLSGTPMLNNPAELGTLVNLAAGKQLLPDNPTDFRKQYFKEEEVKPGFLGRLAGVSPGLKYTLQNKPALKKILDQYVDYYQPTQEGYPSVTEENVNVPMGKNQQDIYNSILGRAGFMTRYKVKHNIPPGRGELEGMKAFLSGPRQVSNSTAGFTNKIRDVQSPKINEAYKFFANKLQEDPSYKAVVYSNYLNNGIKPYEDLLKKNNIPFGEFSGDVSPTQRDQYVRDYNANKLKALLISGAGAEGLDLKNTRLEQLLDPHWNLAKERQVIGRGVRFHSHEGLPPEKQHVLVQRYFAQPKPSMLDRFTFNSKPTGTDAYIHNLAKQKDQMNQEVVNLIAPKKTWWPED